VHVQRIGWAREAKGFKVKLRSGLLSGNSRRTGQCGTFRLLALPGVSTISQFPGQGRIISQLVDEPLGSTVILMGEGRHANEWPKRFSWGERMYEFDRNDVVYLRLWDVM
jgi:hypothetical protein